MEKRESCYEDKPYTVSDMCLYLGIGKNKGYELVKSKGFPAKKIGKKYLIPKKGLLEWVEKCHNIVN